MAGGSIGQLCFLQYGKCCLLTTTVIMLIFNLCTYSCSPQDSKLRK
jgi:hypothetical protein